MKKLLKSGWWLLPLLLLLCCWAANVVPLPSTFVGSGVEALPGSMRSGVHPPGGGSCANVGVFFEENPFVGWPVTRFMGDWKVISSWFCDPTYFRGFTHWGIDLAARVTATEWGSIDHAEVIYTGERGVVTAAANDGGRNYGMGNHVIVRYVECNVRCGSIDEPTDEWQWLFLKQSNSFKCPYHRPTPTPDPDEPTPTPDFYAPTPTPIYEDLILDCRNNGWRVSYFHLFDIAVQPGSLVEYEQVLGWIDNTGNSTGPHLHYQINGPDEVGAIDPGPAMCEDYSNALLDIWRWERPVCQNYYTSGGE